VLMPSREIPLTRTARYDAHVPLVRVPLQRYFPNALASLLCPRFRRPEHTALARQALGGGGTPGGDPTPHSRSGACRGWPGPGHGPHQHGVDVAFWSGWMTGLQRPGSIAAYVPGMGDLFFHRAAGRRSGRELASLRRRDVVCSPLSRCDSSVGGLVEIVNAVQHRNRLIVCREAPWRLPRSPSWVALSAGSRIYH